MKCAFEGCDKDVVVKGYCRGHYQQHWNGVTLRPLREKKMLPTDDEGRVCTSCEVYKPWSEFYKQNNSMGHRSKCKECLKAAERVNRLGRA